MKLSVTSKKELADMTPSKKKNKGWFKPKNETGDESIQKEVKWKKQKILETMNQINGNKQH